MNSKKIFDNFPKSRPPLPEKIKLIYETQYKKNREGKSTASSASQKMEKWMHKKTAMDVVSNHTRCTLEVGAGTLNHLNYEHSEKYDIIEPFVNLFRNSENLKFLRNIYLDINEIEIQPTYDRIISIATFEHITNLPEVVAKLALLLNEKGQLRVSIPNEGSLIWKMGWKLTTGLEFRFKYKANYGDLMKHEHVNNAKEIEDILYYFFDKIDKDYSGLSSSLSFYKFYKCLNPRIERCKNYLSTL